MPTLIDSSSGNCSQGSLKTYTLARSLNEKIKQFADGKTHQCPSVFVTIAPCLMDEGLKMRWRPILRRTWSKSSCVKDVNMNGKLRVGIFLFICRLDSHRHGLWGLFFFISSSFVPSRQSALESNPVLVRVKSKIPGAGLLTLSTIRLNFDLWMKIITSFACYVYSDVIPSERERGGEWSGGVIHGIDSARVK